jgi:hypothetical protein
MKTIHLVWLCLLALATGCNKQSAPGSQGWSAPVKVADTKDSLVGGVVLLKWHDSILALQPQEQRTAKCFVLTSNDTLWAEAPLMGVPRGYSWYQPAIEQTGDRVLFNHYKKDDQLEIAVLVGRMAVNESVVVRNAVEKIWITNTKALWGADNIRLTEHPGSREESAFRMGNIDDTDLCLPFCLEGFTCDRNGVALARGPYISGVFHSTDSGTTWQIERISDSQAFSPALCKTKANCYFFAASLARKRGQGTELWFSQKPVTGSSWGEPTTLTKTFGNEYVTTSRDDTVHLCWLDTRHEKRRNNEVYPHQGNYEVAYSQRKDSDANWSNDVILSQGLLYAFAPSMAVEGDRIAVAWAGVQTAGVWHGPLDPNDIYYVTSKDGGRRWTKPLRATDNIKAGITAGDPQVVLQNGVIHLTYTQGRINLKQESPGLTKLNQPPWPIYYTQRPFPE